LAFQRNAPDGTRLLVALAFGHQPRELAIPAGGAQLLLSSYLDQDNRRLTTVMTLRPAEGSSAARAGDRGCPRPVSPTTTG
jgi:hypothetical protein